MSLPVRLVRLARTKATSRNIRMMFGSLARGDLSVLRGKVLPKLAQSLAPTPPVLDAEGAADIARAVAEREFMLVIDHGMDGGSIHYRQRLVDRHVRAGGAALVLVYRDHLGRYELELFGVDQALRLTVPDPAAIEAFRPTVIMVNSVVKYPDPAYMLTVAQRLAGASGAQLLFPVHDFHAVCPRYNLLGQGGQYCGVPEAASCRDCLQDEDVVAWRRSWEPFLAEAEVVCFSESSACILRRAYPKLAEREVVVRPHEVDHIPRPIAPGRPAFKGGTVHVGVLGAIDSAAKGAGVVQEMARIAAAESLPVRITVIGTMSGNIRRNRLLQVTGAYERATLPELVGRIGPDLFVLPSIWPETFSYAAEEVMLLGYPLAVFDLGAPAERASAYARGLVVGVPEETDEQAARRMLDAIVEWARACGLSNDGLA